MSRAYLDHASTTAGGAATSVLGNGSIFAGLACHNISSCIVHGVFEKFPGLHLLVKEQGIGWMPTLVWRLDHEYRLGRAPTGPPLPAPPSEVVRETPLRNWT